LHGWTEEGEIVNLSETRKKFLYAVSRGDVDMILDLYQPDAVLEAPEGRFEGREQIEQYYRAQLTPLDAELKVQAVHRDGNTEIGEWVMEATHTGDMQLPDGTTLAATGRQVRQRGVDVAVYVDGLVSQQRVYYDNVEALSQLGLLPGSEG
jgi:ketosteroid isomerase-like protein